MEAPENTLQSFLHANKNKVDVIETDVQITADGQIIVCHDHTFDRLCSPASMKGPGQKVRETLSTELPMFKQEMPMHFSANKTYNRKSSDQNTYTKLSEIFEILPKS